MNEPFNPDTENAKQLGYAILFFLAIIGLLTILGDDKSCWVGHGKSKEWICDTR